MSGPRLLLVEDALNRTWELKARRERLITQDQSALAEMRSALPQEVLAPAPEEVCPWTLAGRTKRKSEPHPPWIELMDWDGTETVLVDCLDRDAPYSSDEKPSAFFALDVFEAFRRRQRQGLPIPRVVAYGKTVKDDAYVQAALQEFTHPVLEEEIDHGEIVRALRLAARPPDRGFQPVVAAVFEQSVLVEKLGRILTGDLSGAIALPGLHRPISREFGTRSCLASLSLMMRDRLSSEEWAEWILGPPSASALPEGLKGRIRRVGLRTIEPSPSRGQPRAPILVNIARALANPHPSVTPPTEP